MTQSNKGCCGRCLGKCLQAGSISKGMKPLCPCHSVPTEKCNKCGNPVACGYCGICKGRFCELHRKSHSCYAPTTEKCCCQGVWPALKIHTAERCWTEVTSSPTTEKVNFIQVGDFHCFGCHGTFPPNDQHIYLCKEEPKKCTEKCGKWFTPPKQEWEERFEKFWPSISVGYDGSEADAMKRDETIKSITTLITEAREDERKNIDLLVMQGYRKGEEAERERVRKMVEGMLKPLKDWPSNIQPQFVHGHNSVITDIINSLK